MKLMELFQKKAPERPPSDEPASPIYYMDGQAVRVISSNATITAEAAQRSNPQLYRITNFVASSVQLVPWYCEPDPDLRNTTDRAPPGKINPINDLLKSPNDSFTSQQFQYWIALNLMLHGRAHFKVGVKSDGTSTPNGLYPLAAKYTKGILNSRGTVEAYEYGTNPESKVVLPTRRNARPREAYAAEISLPSLSGLVEYNKAPAAIESIAKPVAIINALMQRALDTASGHPNVKYVITAEKTLTRQQKEMLGKHLEESTPGEDYSGSVLFLYNTSLVIHKLDNDLQDIHSKLPLDDMTRQIAGVFGVPIALLGLGSADSAKYASNYNESRLSFWQDTIAPCYLAPISAGMTQAICPPGAKISFDFDSIPAMWEGRAKLGETLSRVNFLTTDEKREILGFKPDPNIPQIMLSSGTAISADGAPIDGAGDTAPPEADKPPTAADPAKKELIMRIVP
jgi:phage portal protein BeeE